MEHHKSVELSVVGLDVLANLCPVLHPHVARVEERIILENGVENAVLLVGELVGVGDSVGEEDGCVSEGGGGDLVKWGSKVGRRRERYGERESVHVCVCLREKERKRERERAMYIYLRESDRL